MFKGIESILFPTDLTKNCVPAFDAAVILAIQFKAKIVLLHVVEKIPHDVEGRLEGLLGYRNWKEVVDSYENEIRQRLIGKRSTNALIKRALKHLCNEAGIDEASCGYQAREVVIDEGEVAECIIKNAEKNACDMIIMGAHEGQLLVKSIGNNIKSVLQKSKIPVMVVPIDPEKKQEMPDSSR